VKIFGVKPTLSKYSIYMVKVKMDLKKVWLDLFEKISRWYGEFSSPDFSNFKSLHHFTYEISSFMLHSTSFSPKTSKISPVSAQPELRVGFRMFFVKPEVLVTQN
jgi:hypothetical protein